MSGAGDVRRYDPGKPLVFAHVPRTGGTTVWHLLRGWFGKDFMQDGQPGPGQVRHDHFVRRRGMGVEKVCPGAEQFVTFLRDPVERFLSQYFFWKATGGPLDYGVETLHPGETSLSQFVDVATRYEMWADLFDVLPLDDCIPYGFDDYVFVGVTSEMQLCCDALADALGKPRVAVTRGNNAPRDEVLSARDRSRLEGGLWREREAYRYVVQSWCIVWDEARG